MLSASPKMLLAAFLLATSLLPTLYALSIWPQPAEVSYHDKVRPLSHSFTIKLPSPWEHDDDLKAAVKRTLDRIHSSAVPLYSSDYGAAQVTQASHGKPLTELQVQVSRGSAASPKRSSHVFANEKQSHGAAAKSKTGGKSLRSLSTAPLEDLDESYTLQVPDGNGVAVLQAKNALGVLRGLATFSQLVYSKLGDKKALYIEALPIKISDKAAFPYRGIMLDTARNYLSPNAIKRQLDAMEQLKLNQLHWHMTDTASWPLDLKTKGMDVMAKKGAYPDSVYTKAMIVDIIHYAAQRGINVIVEIDMPGHQFMGVKDYPGDLIVCGDEKAYDQWGAEPPTGHLDIRKPAAATLMKDILTEIAAYLPSPYFSTGNDEVKSQCYGLQKADEKGVDKLLAPFVDDVHSHLVALGKTPMVWEEAVLDHPQTASRLKKGTLVETWAATGDGKLELLLKARPDLRIILAPYDYFYLDCGRGPWVGKFPNGASWCNFVNWQHQYLFDPLNNTQAIQGSQQRIMGGESALWSEQADEDNLEILLWPRAASGADVYWSGNSFSINGVRTQRKQALPLALPRLHQIRARLRASGIRVEALQPQWCATRPGSCDLTS